MPYHRTIKPYLWAFVFAIIIAWFRAPERLANGFLWAEDGPVFLLEARLNGAAAILSPHAGYLHLIPRLIAWVQNGLPLTAAPYVFAWTALLLVALASSYIAYAARELPPAVALMFAVAPMLSPQNGELLLNITNIQWMLSPCLLVLLWENLFRPPQRGIALRIAACIALTLTGPFGVLISPVVVLAAVYVYRKEALNRSQAGFLLAYGGAVLLQAYMMIRYPLPSHPVGVLPWGPRALREIFSDLLPGAPMWGGMLLAVMVFASAWASRARVVALLLLLVGLEIWAISAARVNDGAPALAWFGNGSRYLYLPLLFVWWAAMLAALRAKYRWAAYAASGVAVLVLLASAGHFEAQSWSACSLQAVPGGYEISLPPGWKTMIPTLH